jgi:hypothetical protein
MQELIGNRKGPVTGEAPIRIGFAVTAGKAIHPYSIRPPARMPFPDKVMKGINIICAQFITSDIEKNGQTCNCGRDSGLPALHCRS